MERAIVIGLLKKLGVADASELSNERAQRRLSKRLEKMGPPDDMTDAEKALVEEITSGNGAATTKEEPATEPEPASTPAAEPKPARTGAKPAKKAAKAEAPKVKHKPDKSTKKPAGTKPLKARAAFKEFFAHNKTTTRDDLMTYLDKKVGAKPQTVASYIYSAKDPKDPYNYGFLLVESKDDKGNKVLTRK